jgi:F-type H+-transporting ATPase subunit epsilon
MADKVKLIYFKMLTPEKTVYEGEVEMIIFKAIDGDIGVLAGHEPMTTVLGIGEMRVIEETTERVFAVAEGFAKVDENGLMVLADTAEKPDEIDTARAQAAVERAMRIINERDNEVEVKKAELALRKAHVRLEVSSFPIIRNRGTGA